MTDDILIRSAREEERFVLGDLAFRSKAFWGYSPEFMEACSDELSLSHEAITNPDRRYLVAELEGEIVGYYALERLSAKGYELEALFVEPHRIGQGVGRKLIEHAKGFARREGAQFLLIQSDPNAVDFYLAAGGVRVGERESDSIPGRYLPEIRISLVRENAA